MSIRVTFEESNWLVLPARFPTEEGETAEAWLDGVVERMRPAWTGDFDSATEEAVRAELRAGLDSVRSEDSIVLQYWRWSAPVAAVVHLAFGDLDPTAERPRYLLEEGVYSADPAFEVVTAEHLGDGVEVRVLWRPDGVEEDVAGLTQLYVSGDRFVAVGVDATLPVLLALLLADLRDLLDTAVVLDDEGAGPWMRSEVPPDTLPVRGESWWTTRDAASAPPA